MEAAEAAGFSREAVERLYGRIRDAFDAGCRAVLTGAAGGSKPLVAWPIRGE